MPPGTQRCFDSVTVSQATMEWRAGTDPAPHRSHQAARPMWIAFHTFSGVAGMSMLFTPA